jgi:hypothetical protein
MKTKSCADYIEEFASYVAESGSLGENAAGHLRRCARCQQKVAELKGVAANYREDSLRIPEPRRRLRRAELQRLLAGEGRQSRSTWWRPVLAGGVAIVVAIAISVTWKSPEPNDLALQVKSLPAAPLKESAIAPTMLALHHDLQGGREQILALGPALTPTRNGMNHYRVRDVERELR